MLFQLRSEQTNETPDGREFVSRFESECGAVVEITSTATAWTYTLKAKGCDLAVAKKLLRKRIRLMVNGEPADEIRV